MTVLPLACFSFCPNQSFSLQSAFTGRASCCAMRKRRTVKPSSARRDGKFRTNAVSRLKDVSRRPATIAVALTSFFAVVGLLTARAAQNGTLKHALNSSFRKSSDTVHDPLKPMSRAPASRAPVYSAKVVADYVHDYKAFTQGLAFHKGQLFESTGLRGRSSLRHIDVETGTVIRTKPLKRKDFGEGLAIIGENGDRIVQLLWKTGKGYIYNRDNFTLESEFSYEGDGWGIASVPGRSNEVFLSDGSSRIRIYRVEGSTFVRVGEFTVRDGLKDVGLLNELEMVGDELWANVWLSSYMARIDPKTGLVTSWLDLRNILDESTIPAGHRVDVLNGIAYDESTQRIYVTGKLWPRMYSIEVSEKRVADNIDRAGDAFFLDPARVKYVHESVIGM